MLTCTLSSGRKIPNASSMTLEATIPVAMNTDIIDPMMRPRRVAEFMFATADAIEKNTMGTTRVNIMLMNTVPNGFKTVALSPMTSPTIAPTTTPVRIKIGNR